MKGLIRDLPSFERPRERVREHGLEALSLQELLVLILGRGSKNASVMQICAELLSKYPSLQLFANTEIEELCTVKGLGYAKALQIKAAFELGKRWNREVVRPQSRNVLKSSDAFQ